jgi:hypothetical protein
MCLYGASEGTMSVMGKSETLEVFQITWLSPLACAQLRAQNFPGLQNPLAIS